MEAAVGWGRNTSWATESAKRLRKRERCPSAPRRAGKHHADKHTNRERSQSLGDEQLRHETSVRFNFHGIIYPVYPIRQQSFIRRQFELPCTLTWKGTILVFERIMQDMFGRTWDSVVLPLPNSDFTKSTARLPRVTLQCPYGVRIV